MTSPPTPIAIGLGSNLGDRAEAIRKAVALLDRVPGLEVAAVSSLHESAPWGDTDQGAFLNAAAVGHFRGAAEALLAHTQAIERALGKRVVRRWGPRRIDVDVLLFGAETHAAERLRVPHPGIWHRPFVYLPLREAMALAAREWPAAWRGEPSAEGLAIARDTAPLASRVGFPMHGAAATALVDLDGLHRLAAAAAEVLLPGEAIGLTGPLGAGKSELARAILRALGVTGAVPSPTFTICRTYETRIGPAGHWDWYRLGDEADLESTAWNDPAQAPALAIVEWADRFPGALPPHALRLTLDVQPDERRRIAAHRADGCIPLWWRDAVRRAEAHR
jgi:2-amino-4-hydroxy-6-hydroxymethyldihydropteridine diphosphokinase